MSVSSARLRSNSAVQPAGPEKENTRASYILQRLMSGEQHSSVSMGCDLYVWKWCSERKTSVIC